MATLSVFYAALNEVHAQEKPTHPAKVETADLPQLSTTEVLHALNVAFKSFDSNDRKLLLSAFSDLQTVRKKRGMADLKLLFRKAQKFIKLLDGTDEQKVKTIKLLCRIASSKDGMEFIRNNNFCDKPLRLDSSLELTRNFDIFLDKNQNLIPDVIRVYYGNLSFSLNKKTMTDFESLLKQKQAPVQTVYFAH